MQYDRQSATSSKNSVSTLPSQILGRTDPMEISQETKSQAQNVVSTQFGLLKVAVSYIEKYINDQFTKQYSEFPTQLDEMRKLISMISTCCETHILEGMVVICTH